MTTNDSKDQGREAFEAWNDSQTVLEFEDAEAENHALTIFRAGFAAALATSASALARDEASVESHVVFITDRSKSIDEVLPQDRRWVLSHAIGRIAAYRNCDAGKTKEVMQEFVDYLRAALDDSAASSASTVSDAASVASGTKLMPPKLTPEMRKAMVDAARDYMERTGGNSPDAMYEAAFAAATKAATAAPEGLREAFDQWMNENPKFAHCHVSAWEAVKGVAALIATSQAATTAEAQGERAHGNAAALKPFDDEAFEKTERTRFIGVYGLTPEEMPNTWTGWMDCAVRIETRTRAASSATAPLTSDSDALKDAGESVTLTGAQLAEALDFIAPDRDSDQLETEATIQYSTGHSGKGLYCWITEYPEEGAILLDGTASPSTNGEQS